MYKRQVYENPYFKVSAGRCVTAEEAIMLLERVRVKFPKAFLMRETMRATDLLEESPGASQTQERVQSESPQPATADPAAAVQDEGFL